MRPLLVAAAVALLGGCVSAPVDVTNCDIKSVFIATTGHVYTNDCGRRQVQLTEPIATGTRVYRAALGGYNGHVVAGGYVRFYGRYATSPLEHPDAPWNDIPTYVSE